VAEAETGTGVVAEAGDAAATEEGDDIYVSAHAYWNWNDGLTVVPQGSSLALYTPLDTELSNSIANEIELGGGPNPTSAWGGGSWAPNFTVTDTGNLLIEGDPYVVPQGQSVLLSDIFAQFPGKTIHLLACTTFYCPP
jgi:hypothetical protein